MNTFETAAVIKLVDHLSHPLHEMVGKVAGHESTLGRHAERMGALGQRMTMSVTLPIVAGLKEMADKALEFSKIENTMRGVLEQRARSVDNLTMSTKAYAAAQLDAVNAAAQSAYEGVGGLPKGLVNVKEYQESVLAAVKAGYQDTATNDPTRSMIPAQALANQAAVLSVANRVDAHTATDDLIALSNALQVETRDKEGHALGLDELNRKFGHIADVLSTMYTSSNFDGHKEVVQSLKMAAPLARFAGLNVGQIAMMSATQKEAGFRGDESSVAQRSMIGSFLSPKNSAYGAFASIGLNLHDYQSASGTMSPEAFVKVANLRGYKVAQQAINSAFGKFKNEGVEYMDLDKLSGHLRDAVLATGKAKNPIKPEIAQKVADSFIAAYVKSTDVPRMIEDIRSTHQASVAWWAQVGEKRQAPRLLPILNPPATKEARDEFVNEGQRQYGPNWEMMMGMKGPIAPGPTPQGFIEEQAGIAARQAAEHAKSLEGAYLQVHNGFEMVVAKMAERHVFDRVAEDIVKVMDAFARLDPKVIELGTEAAMAAAAIGPLLSVLGLALGIVPAVAKLGPMLSGTLTALPAAERAFHGTTAAAHGTARALPTASRAFAWVTTEAERAAAAQARETVAKRTAVRATLAYGRAIDEASDLAVRRAAQAAADTRAAISEGVLQQRALAERYAAQSAEMMAGEAQRVAARAAEGLSRGSAAAGKAAAVTNRLALSLDSLSGAADRAAAGAQRQLANVASFAERNAAEAAARAAAATERGLARQELAVARYESSIATRLTQIGARLQAAGGESTAALSKVLGDFVQLNPAAENAAAAAQRAVASAVEAGSRAAAVGDQLIAAQTAENAAKQAATTSAQALAKATRDAAEAMNSLAQRQGAARVAEEAAARVSARGAQEIAARGANVAAQAAERQATRGTARASQEAAARGADVAARAAEQGVHPGARAAERAAQEAAARAADVEAKGAAKVAADQAARHTGFVAEQAAIAAKDAAARAATRAGVFKLAAGIVEGANPLIDLYSAIEIGQEKMERTHQVLSRQASVNGGVRSYRDVSVGHYDPSYFEHHDAETPARVYDRAIADRNRENPRDEGVRARAAYPIAGVGPAQPQHVDVSGTVTGQAEIHQNLALEVRPSRYFEALVQRAETAAQLNLRGMLGQTMEGSNGVGPPARLLGNPAGIGHM